MPPFGLMFFELPGTEGGDCLGESAHPMTARPPGSRAGETAGRNISGRGHVAEQYFASRGGWS
jgi:hypothetical protein